VFRSYDTLRSAPKFKRPTFEAVWDEIFCFAAMPNAYRPTATGLHKPVAIADRQGWLVGETLEHALATVQRELAGKEG
jgi:hypothetical protein